MTKIIKQKISEADIQTFILDFLTTSRIGYFWRNNTVGVYDPTRCIYRKNKKQEKGIPDILGVMCGRFIAIECKSSTVKKLSDDQEKFKEQFERSDGIFYMANDIDAFRIWIKELKHILTNKIN